MQADNAIIKEGQFSELAKLTSLRERYGTGEHLTFQPFQEAGPNKCGWDMPTKRLPIYNLFLAGKDLSRVTPLFAKEPVEGAYWAKFLEGWPHLVSQFSLRLATRMT